MRINNKKVFGEDHFFMDTIKDSNGHGKLTSLLTDKQRLEMLSSPNINDTGYAINAILFRTDLEFSKHYFEFLGVQKKLNTIHCEFTLPIDGNHIDLRDCFPEGYTDESFWIKVQNESTDIAKILVSKSNVSIFSDHSLSISGKVSIASLQIYSHEVVVIKNSIDVEDTGTFLVYAKELIIPSYVKQIKAGKCAFYCKEFCRTNGNFKVDEIQIKSALLEHNAYIDSKNPIQIITHETIQNNNIYSEKGVLGISHKWTYKQYDDELVTTHSPGFVQLLVAEYDHKGRISTNNLLLSSVNGYYDGDLIGGQKTQVRAERYLEGSKKSRFYFNGIVDISSNFTSKFAGQLLYCEDLTVSWKNISRSKPISDYTIIRRVDASQKKVIRFNAGVYLETTGNIFAKSADLFLFSNYKHSHTGNLWHDEGLFGKYNLYLKSTEIAIKGNLTTTGNANIAVKQDLSQSGLIDAKQINIAADNYHLEPYGYVSTYQLNIQVEDRVQADKKSVIDAKYVYLRGRDASLRGSLESKRAAIEMSRLIYVSGKPRVEELICTSPIFAMAGFIPGIEKLLITSYVSLLTGLFLVKQMNNSSLLNVNPLSLTFQYGITMPSNLTLAMAAINAGLSIANLVAPQVTMVTVPVQIALNSLSQLYSTKQMLDQARATVQQLRGNESTSNQIRTTIVISQLVVTLSTILLSLKNTISSLTKLTVPDTITFQNPGVMPMVKVAGNSLGRLVSGNNNFSLIDFGLLRSFVGVSSVESHLLSFAISDTLAFLSSDTSFLSIKNGLDFTLGPSSTTSIVRVDTGNTYSLTGNMVTNYGQLTLLPLLSNTPIPNNPFNVLGTYYNWSIQADHISYPLTSYQFDTTTLNTKYIHVAKKQTMYFKQSAVFATKIDDYGKWVAEKSYVHANEFYVDGHNMEQSAPKTLTSSPEKSNSLNIPEKTNVNFMGLHVNGKDVNDKLQLAKDAFKNQEGIHFIPEKYYQSVPNSGASVPHIDPNAVITKAVGEAMPLVEPKKDENAQATFQGSELDINHMDDHGEVFTVASHVNGKVDNYNIYVSLGSEVDMKNVIGHTGSQTQYALSTGKIVKVQLEDKALLAVDASTLTTSTFLEEGPESLTSMRSSKFTVTDQFKINGKFDAFNSELSLPTITGDNKTAKMMLTDTWLTTQNNTVPVTKTNSVVSDGKDEEAHKKFLEKQLKFDAKFEEGRIIYYYNGPYTIQNQEIYSILPIGYHATGPVHIADHFFASCNFAVTSDDFFFTDNNAQILLMSDAQFEGKKGTIYNKSIVDGRQKLFSKTDGKMENNASQLTGDKGFSVTAKQGLESNPEIITKTETHKHWKWHGIHSGYEKKTVTKTTINPASMNAPHGKVYLDVPEKNIHTVATIFNAKEIVLDAHDGEAILLDAEGRTIVTTKNYTILGKSKDISDAVVFMPSALLTKDGVVTIRANGQIYGKGLLVEANDFNLYTKKKAIFERPISYVKYTHEAYGIMPSASPNSIFSGTIDPFSYMPLVDDGRQIANAQSNLGTGAASANLGIDAVNKGNDFLTDIRKGTSLPRAGGNLLITKDAPTKLFSFEATLGYQKSSQEQEVLGPGGIDAKHIHINAEEGAEFNNGYELKPGASLEINAKYTKFTSPELHSSFSSEQTGVTGHFSLYKMGMTDASFGTQYANSSQVQHPVNVINVPDLTLNTEILTQSSTVINADKASGHVGKIDIISEKDQKSSKSAHGSVGLGGSVSYGQQESYEEKIPVKSSFNVKDSSGFTVGEIHTVAATTSLKADKMESTDLPLQNSHHGFDISLNISDFSSYRPPFIPSGDNTNVLNTISVNITKGDEQINFRLPFINQPGLEQLKDNIHYFTQPVTSVNQQSIGSDLPMTWAYKNINKEINIEDSERTEELAFAKQMDVVVQDAMATTTKKSVQKNVVSLNSDSIELQVSSSKKENRAENIPVSDISDTPKIKRTEQELSDDFYNSDFYRRNLPNSWFGNKYLSPELFPFGYLATTKSDDEMACYAPSSTQNSDSFDSIAVDPNVANETLEMLNPISSANAGEVVISAKAGIYLTSSTEIMDSNFRSNDSDSSTLSDYSHALFSGTISGVKGTINTYLHPFDEVIYPAYKFMDDANVLLAKYYLINYPEATYKEAAHRMQERVDNAEAFLNEIKNSSGPERVEMATSLIVSVLIPGGAAKGAKLLLNYSRFKTFTTPPLFHNNKEFDLVIPTPKIKEYTIDEIRSQEGKKGYIYTITEDRKLKITSEKYSEPVLRSDGESIDKASHAELAGLKPVYASGWFEVEDGLGAELNNWSGHYYTGGEHLKGLVETAFVRNGFKEARGLFEDSFSSRKEPIIVKNSREARQFLISEEDAINGTEHDRPIISIKPESWVLPITSGIVGGSLNLLDQISIFNSDSFDSTSTFSFLNLLNPISSANAGEVVIPAKAGIYLSSSTGIMDSNFRSNDSDPSTLSDYSYALYSGTLSGVKSTINTFLHPFDEVIYPTYKFIDDANVLLAKYYLINYPEGTYKEATHRMQERVEDAQEFLDEIKYSTGPERVEMGTSFLVSSLIPGGMAKGAKSLLNYSRFRTFSTPPLFHNNSERELIFPLPKIKEYTVDEIRNRSGYRSYIYVIDEDRKLKITDEKYPTPLYYKDRVHIFVYHPELAQLKPVYASGQFLVEDGIGYSIGNFSGHYFPRGDNLQGLVETAFIRNGFKEADGAFKYSFDSNVEPYIVKNAEEARKYHITELDNVERRQQARPIISKKTESWVFPITSGIVAGSFNLLDQISNSEVNSAPVVLPAKAGIDLSSSTGEMDTSKISIWEILNPISSANAAEVDDYPLSSYALLPDEKESINFGGQDDLTQIAALSTTTFLTSNYDHAILKNEYRLHGQLAYSELPDYYLSLLKQEEPIAPREYVSKMWDFTYGAPRLDSASPITKSLFGEKVTLDDFNWLKYQNPEDAWNAFNTAVENTNFPSGALRYYSKVSHTMGLVSVLTSAFTIGTASNKWHALGEESYAIGGGFLGGALVENASNVLANATKNWLESSTLPIETISLFRAPYVTIPLVMGGSVLGGYELQKLYDVSDSSEIGANLLANAKITWKDYTASLDAYNMHLDYFNETRNRLARVLNASELDATCFGDARKTYAFSTIKNYLDVRGVELFEVSQNSGPIGTSNYLKNLPFETYASVDSPNRFFESLVQNHPSTIEPLMEGDYLKVLDNIHADHEKSYFSQTHISKLGLVSKGGTVLGLFFAGNEVIKADNKVKETIHQGVLFESGEVGGVISGELAAMRYLCQVRPLCVVGAVITGSTIAGVLANKGWHAAEKMWQDYHKPEVTTRPSPQIKPIDGRIYGPHQKNTMFKHGYDDSTYKWPYGEENKKSKNFSR